jgi:hypothetical protein
MKKLSLIPIIFFFLASTLNAQFKKGNIELSLSGSIGNRYSKTSNSSSGNSYSSSSNDSYFNLFCQPAYYLADNFSIGTEFGLSVGEGAGLSCILNASYTFHNPNALLAPYIVLGYGFGNTLSSSYVGYLYEGSDKYNINILNAGLGLKYLISKSAILKAELNYRSHFWSTEYKSHPYSTTIDYRYTTIAVIIGFSILL